MKYATFNSDFISVAIDTENARLAFMGIDSGGREKDRHTTFNLMLPSHGATIGNFKKKAPRCVDFCDNLVSFKGENGESAEYAFDGERKMTLALKGAPRGDLFTINLSIKTAPPTIWSQSVKKAPHHMKSKNPLVLFKTKYAMPLIVHFPDFGLLEISADCDDAYAIEELTKSGDYSGLSLGYLNYDVGHRDMYALNFGSSKITIKTKSSHECVNLSFKVLPEQYPALKNEDNPRYNGLKRCWLNSFALNRERFDMGDNIYLNGTGHLSVHMKSDLLRAMGGENELFALIRSVFERQIEQSFKKCQAPDGEVNFDYYDKPKARPMCDFIDSTPSAVIALAGIASWNLPFAKRLIPYAKKALDFLMSLDTDSDGIIEVTFPGDYMEQESELGYRQRNWWDNFAFGHKDIYFNCLCHRAFVELSELLVKIGRADEARGYIDFLDKFERSFFDTFYNPKTSLMAGWISHDGQVHDYAFTFACAMAINEGLVPLDLGRQMLQSLLKKMDEQGYGDLRYGIPGNVEPIGKADTGDWPCMTDWGRYENGGLSGMNGYCFLKAMYKTGLKNEADKIFFTILNTYEKEFTHTGLMPGYCQSIDWRTKEGNPCGYNYLADNYYFLLVGASDERL